MRILLADSPPKTPPRRNNNSSNGDGNDDDWRQNVFLSQSVSLYVVNDSFIVLLTSIFTITKPRWSNRTNYEFSCCFAVRQRLCRLQEKDSVKWFVLCAGGGGSCDFGITRRKNCSQAANTEAKNGGSSRELLWTAKEILSAREAHSMHCNTVFHPSYLFVECVLRVLRVRYGFVFKLCINLFGTFFISLACVFFLRGRINHRDVLRKEAWEVFVMKNNGSIFLLFFPLMLKEWFFVCKINHNWMSNITIKPDQSSNVLLDG